MSDTFLCNVEFNVDDFDIWDKTTSKDDSQIAIKFTMNPTVCLKIEEEEFIEQINCDKKMVKSETFSLTGKDLKSDLKGKITVIKQSCSGKEDEIGIYSFPKIQETFKQLRDRLVENQPTFHTFKELVQLVSRSTTIEIPSHFLPIDKHQG
jgi:hypothetical protein